MKTGKTSYCGHANYFPVRLIEHDEQDPELFADENSAPTANLSLFARDYLHTLGLPDADKDAEPEDVIWLYALAIGYSAAYASENAAALRQDWPRVPLPAERELLLASAELGRRVAALLNPEAPVKGVTTAPAGNFADEDYAITARWGYAGNKGVTMPGRGRLVERPFDANEQAALGEAIALFGETTCDVYLNERAYWKNVPLPVWEYTLGGYQVLKKWLSYREEPLLGRPLTVDEVTYVRDCIRRIAALLLLGPELDAHYAAVKAAVSEWPVVAATSADTP